VECASAWPRPRLERPVSTSSCTWMSTSGASPPISSTARTSSTPRPRRGSSARSATCWRPWPPGPAGGSASSPFSPPPSATSSSTSGTTRFQPAFPERPRIRGCTRSSRRRPGGPRRLRRPPSMGRSSLIASSPTGPAGWPATSAPWAAGPKRGSASPWSAGWTCRSPCSPFWNPGPRTCRSTPTTPASGWPGCSRTPRRAC
jgi:hypothetical protein